jgi:hypothetical protein
MFTFRGVFPIEIDNNALSIKPGTTELCAVDRSPFFNSGKP